MSIYSWLGGQISRVSWYLKYRLAKIRAKAASLRTMSERRPKKILVLCYGNIYRSPFVSAYLKSKLDNSLYTVESAGFFPKQSRCTPEAFVTMARNHGIDLSNHKSSTVNAEMMDRADAIIIMDGKNYKMSLMCSSVAEEKLVWLGSLLNLKEVEIEDPYGKTETEQKIILQRMISASEEFCKLLSLS